MLTINEIEDFKLFGMSHIKKALDTETLVELQNMVDEIEVRALNRQNEELFKDCNFSLELFRPVLHRIKNINRHGSLSLLNLLMHNKVIVNSLCSPDAVLTGDMVIFKRLSCAQEIPWHQDIVECNADNSIITLGIYLDDSPVGEGNVQFVPGTHTEKQDVCQIAHGNNQPEGVIEFDVKAGDIVVHNPMVLHRSGTMVEQHRRRTLYLEFRSQSNIQSHADWPSQFLAARQQLMSLAKQYQNELVTQPDLIDEAEYRLRLEQIYAVKLPPLPANYCQCS